ncbi:hypothetical protein PR202_gb13258 [Eleusine coracana subsp. coracana]|uniref:Uncharacterized protein n=1 Tax=Eleusine coracana subsp. coracana TaxID=191504 RepID=A0AAV5ES32_ELECO|nr:hypothetical protein PR202_gb13258 [Eleusine coracana subsp. coracana]
MDIGQLTICSSHFGGPLQQCSINSPRNGPLPSDAPPWCEAPFDPEGLLRCLLGMGGCFEVLYVIPMYIQVDMYGYKKPLFPMEWVGKHALIIFVLVACNIVPILLQGFYWREPHNNLVRHTSS